jgi:hypothetical protein
MRIFIFVAGAIFYFLNTNSLSSTKDYFPDETSDNQLQEATYDNDDEVNIENTLAYFNEDINLDEIEVAYEDEEQQGNYIPDNNPVTWDEDPENYPLETPRTYENVDDEEVQSPTHYNNIPKGACAICRDGTYSFSKNRRGTCSHHGGVSMWLK